MGIDISDVDRLKAHYDVDFRGVFENEAPAREITVSSFRMDRFEVTNARFAEFVAAQPNWTRKQLDPERHNGDYLSHWLEGRPPEGRADHPVVFITWHAAQAFCRWAGGRLPTEAEWEYAARAGDDREFPWGDEPPAPERVNYYRSELKDTSPVGSYPPNDFGLHDLAGNVWEFLLDEWTDRHPPGPAVDPVVGGPFEGDEWMAVEGRRAVRGASFGGSEVNLRTRWRDSHVVTNAIAFVGFRCAYPITSD